MRPVQLNLQCNLNLLASTVQADTTFATDLPIYGHVTTKSADQPKCIFESSGGINAPILAPNATPTPQPGSLSLVIE